MARAERPSGDVLVLRAWIEGHQVPLRVRVVRFVDGGGERASIVVHRRDDVLAIVADWLDELADAGRRTDNPERS